MKRTKFFSLLLAFSLFPILCPAQIYLGKQNMSSDSLSYLQKFDNYIQKIDKSIFQTGILYDRVYPNAKLHNFNPNSPTDTSSYEHFIQSYYEIYLAAYSNKNMKSFEEIKKKVKEMFIPDHIDPLFRSMLTPIPAILTPVTFRHIDPPYERV